MNHQLRLRLRLSAFGFSVLLLIACGGRYQTLREVADEADAGRGNGGSGALGSHGGTGGAAGAAGSGANGGSAGSAGHSAGVAGSNAGGASTGDSPACTMGRQAYAQQRELFVSKYSGGCATSKECVIVTPVNSCESGCGYESVWYGAADSFEANLSSVASKYCYDCKRGPTPPCVPPPEPACIAGYCRF